MTSEPARENQRIRSTCKPRSSAKPDASSRASANALALFPACLAPAREPCSAPTTSNGQTTELSFQEARHIAKVPPNTEQLKRMQLINLGTASAQTATSASVVARALCFADTASPSLSLTDSTEPGSRSSRAAN